MGHPFFELLVRDMSFNFQLSMRVGHPVLEQEWAHVGQSAGEISLEKNQYSSFLWEVYGRLRPSSEICASPCVP